MLIEQKYFYKKNSKTKLIIGDVLIWDSTDSNKYGHVAIYLGKLNDELIVFEQDGFKQNGALINIRPMNNLLGILRRK